MFNLSTTGNVGYNGISQLSEAQRNYPDKIENTSGSKLRAYMNSDGKTKFTGGFRTPSVNDGRNVSLVSNLKLNSSKEDVYTFTDSEQPIINNKFLNSSVKSCLTFDKNDGLFPKKTFSGNLLTSSKKVQIVKPVNGFNKPKGNDFSELQNGIHKTLPQDNPIKLFQNKTSPSHRVTVRPNKDLLAPFSANIKIEPDELASNFHDNGLNHSTKSSIISSNVKPVILKPGCIYQNRKVTETVSKPESGIWGNEGSTSSTLSNYSNKSSSKTFIKKIPSGKPPPTSVKVRKGRGPALHEALQRINTSPTTSKANYKGLSNSNQWHSPGSDLFDCGVLESQRFTAEMDSDSSNDSVFDYDHWSSNSIINTGNRSERLIAGKTALRRKITQLQQSEIVLHPSKSSVDLYNAVKMQMQQDKRNTTNSGFRLKGQALDILLSVEGTNSVLSTEDRRRIRYGGRLVEPVSCARPGCGAPSLACARLCLAHISLSPEQRLFSECTAKFSDNTQCRVPVVDVRNELPLCSEHTWKKDNYNKITQDTKPKRAPRKRPKPSAMIRPQKRNRKRKSPNALNTDTFNNHNENNHAFEGLTNDSNLFSNEEIVDGVPSTFLHQDDTTELNVCSNSSACESSEDTGIGGLSETELIGSSNHEQHIVYSDVVAEVLAMHESGELPTLELPPTGPPQDPNIDLSTVFSDFFTEQNGEYVPTREESEELERALEAVNQDVKSLEKLTASHNSALLLDTLLDERVLAETLASLPDVFNNIAPVKNPANAVDPSPSPS